MALYRLLTTDNSIRLLRVHRRHDGKILGQLEDFDLASDHTPEYKAVSYVWGNRASQQTISVNGCNVSVLFSVYPILEALCDTPNLFFPEHDTATPPWVWLDSICINQRDVAEVNQQVACMANVFGKASSAIVWLGPGTSKTDRGMDLVKILAKCEEYKPISHPLLADIEAWEGYREVAASPWWRRVWTLQESLVPQQVVYHYGLKLVSELEIRQAVLVTNESVIPDSLFKLHGTEPWEAMWNRRRILQRHRRTRPTLREQVGLLSLLAYTRHSRASKDKDYVYALVGCVNATDQNIIGRPNYALSTESIYSALCQNWIITWQSLDIICFTVLFEPQCSGSLSDLPSWVPDWRQRHSSQRATDPVPLLVSHPLNQHIGTFMPPKHQIVAPERSRRYSAAGDNKVSYSFSHDMKRLTCVGLTLDVVDGIAAMLDSPVQGSTRVCAPLVQSSSSVNCSFTSLQSRDISCSRSLAVAKDVALSIVFGREDVYLQREADAEQVLSQIKNFIELNNTEIESHAEERRTRELSAWFRYNDSLLIRGIRLGEAFDTQRVNRQTDTQKASIPERNEIKAEISRKFQRAAGITDMARRLAVTNSGHVGMVPQNCRKGDLVCVLYGCSVPVVLRALLHSQYQLIGECYLQGFMEGQAFEDGECRTQEYTII